MYIYTHIHKRVPRKLLQTTGEIISVQIFGSSTVIQLKCPLLSNTQKTLTSPNDPVLYKLFGLIAKEHFSSRGLHNALEVY